MRDDVVWIRVKAVEMKRSGWMLHIPYFEQRANGLDVESVQKKKVTQAMIIYSVLIVYSGEREHL